MSYGLVEVGRPSLLPQLNTNLDGKDIAIFHIFLLLAFSRHQMSRAIFIDRDLLSFFSLAYNLGGSFAPGVSASK